MALLTASDGRPRPNAAVGRRGRRGAREPVHRRVLVEPDTRRQNPGAKAEGEAGRLDVGGNAQEHPAEEGRRGTSGGDLGRRQRRRLLPRADGTACLHDPVPIAELSLARRHLQCAPGPVPGVDAVLGAELADTPHGALGGPADLNRPGIPEAVSQDRQVVPQRRHEASVPPARAVTREAGLEHDDVDSRLERLQLPGRPETEQASAHDDDVARRVALERWRRLDRPCLFEPEAVARMAHAPILEGRPAPAAILCEFAVAVAQLVEPRVVVPVVAGSNPVRHPFDESPGNGAFRVSKAGVERSRNGPFGNCLATTGRGFGRSWRVTLSV